MPVLTQFAEILRSQNHPYMQGNCLIFFHICHILTREVEAKHQTHRQVLQLRPETVDSKWVQILLFMLFRTQIREISTFLLLDKK